MDKHRLLTLPITVWTVGIASFAGADDHSAAVASVAPFSSFSRTPAAATSVFGLVLPSQIEYTPTPAEVVPAEPENIPDPLLSSDSGEGSITGTLPRLPNKNKTSTPRQQTYEEITEKYPAPVQSLVPPALSTGPLFRGAGQWGGARSAGTHLRYPQYNYRSPWTYGGPPSVNHTIHW